MSSVSWLAFLLAFPTRFCCGNRSPFFVCFLFLSHSMLNDMFLWFDFYFLACTLFFYRNEKMYACLLAGCVIGCLQP